MMERLRAAWCGLPVGGVQAVYLFGSHAQGRAHAESDVDIGVLLNQVEHSTPTERFEVRLAIIAHLGGRLGAPTDVVILNDAPPLLGRKIVIDGQAVAVYDAEADRVFRRDVQLRAADIEPVIMRHRRTLLAGLTQ